MIQNSTIYEDSSQLSRQIDNARDYITFGHHDSLPIQSFENELQQNLDDLGTSRKDPQTKATKHSKYYQPIKPRIEQDEIDRFINHCFKKQTQIKCEVFVKQSLKYFIPHEKYSDKQLSYMINKMKKILTTSNPQLISLNALKVLNSQRSFRILLVQLYLQGKYRTKHKQLDIQNSRILQQLSCLQKQMSIEQSELSKRIKQTERKQSNLNQKQKELGAKQKEFKGIISKQYQRLEGKLSKLYAEKTQDLDKKSSNIEKGLKYKIQILDKKIEQLNSIKSGEKANIDKYKQKILKIQKQNTNFKNKIKEIENSYNHLLAEEEEINKKYKVAEEKAIKFQKKIVGLKEQVKIKQIEIANLQELLNVKQKQIKVETELIQKENQEIKRNNKTNKIQEQCLLQVISFTSLFINTIQNTSIKLINSYIAEPQKHLCLPQILFPKAQLLIKSFYSYFSQLLTQNSTISFNPSSISIASHITQLIFFCHKYLRIQKSQSILDKVFQNNKLKSSPQSQYYIIDDDLSTKIIKQIKKLLKTCEFCQTLIISIVSFLCSSSIANKSSSLVIINEIISDNYQLKQKLLNLDFIALFLDKINKKQIEQIDPLLDIILELVTQQELRNKLFESMYATETYKQIWELLPIVVDKTSIVLQRFYYNYKQLTLENNELIILKNVKKTLNKQSLEYANLEAIQSCSL